MNRSTVHCFVLTIVYLCVCYEPFNSSVFCIDYSFYLCVLWTVQQFSTLYWMIIVSLCVCYERFNSSVFCIDYSFSLCVLWTVQQFGVLYWLLFICVCVMNSSTFRCFVLTIVSLCVCYEQFNNSVLYIDYSFSLCVLLTVQQFSTVQYFVLNDYSFSLCMLWTVQQFSVLYWL